MIENKVADLSEKKYCIGMKGIGENIEKLRNANGRMSQKDLADKSGINIETVNRAEHDQNVSIDTLIKIAGALGVTIGDLLPERQHPRLTAPVQNGNTFNDENPEHRRYHSILDQILNSDDHKCIHAVVAVLEAVAGKPSPPAQASSPVYQANNIPAGARPGDRMRARKTGT